MTINELIKALEKIRDERDGFLPVYTNGEPQENEMEVSGVRFADSEEGEDWDTGAAIETIPERVYLKI